MKRRNFIPLRQTAAFMTNALLMLVLLAVSIDCNSKTNGGDSMKMRDLLPDRIDGWSAEDQFETYDRESIFSYIDGAGEVYRMYDFREVVVCHYQADNQPQITAELFDMGKASDALGIFLHSCEGGPEIGLGQGSAQSGGVLMFWQDRYYVNIYADQLTEQSRLAIRSLGSAISQNIPSRGQIPALMNCLPEVGLVPHSQRYFHLHTSLNYHYYLSDQNILALDSATEAVLARYHGGTVYFVCIRYPSAEKAGIALTGFKAAYLPEAQADNFHEIQKDHWVGVNNTGPFLIIIFDAPEKSEAERLTESARVNLNKIVEVKENG